MKTISILFSTAMNIALDQKRKDQTRRLSGLELINQNPDLWELEDYGHDPKTGNMVAYFVNEQSGAVLPCSCRYGTKGDVLWVREAWRKNNIPTGWPYEFKAVDPEGLWKPSIHMPKDACRRFLEVVNIRVERLQDISEEDAIGEGIMQVTKDGRVHKYCVYDNLDYSSTPWDEMPKTAKDSYKSLWDKINKKKMTWDKNPWLWRIQFKEVDKPESF